MWSFRNGPEYDIFGIVLNEKFLEWSILRKFWSIDVNQDHLRSFKINPDQPRSTIINKVQPILNKIIKVNQDQIRMPFHIFFLPPLFSSHSSKWTFRLQLFFIIFVPVDVGFNETYISTWHLKQKCHYCFKKTLNENETMRLKLS